MIAIPNGMIVVCLLALVGGLVVRLAPMRWWLGLTLGVPVAVVGYSLAISPGWVASGAGLGGVLGFFTPSIWRNIIAPHIITLVLWVGVGAYLFYAWHYLPAAEFASQVASLRRPFDYVLWLAAKTDEPLLVAGGIFGAAGISLKVLRSWLDHLVGRLLGGNC